MTSDQIKAIGHADQSTNAWLKEIALQLALLNEKPAEKQPEPPKFQPKARK